MERTFIVHTEEKDTEIRVKASNFTLRLYRAEFNADLIKDLTEIHDKLHPDLFIEAIKKAGIDPSEVSQDELVNIVIKNMDYSQLNADGTERPVLPDADTQIRIMQIIWTMARTADKNIKSFEDWCDEFDLLPMADLADQCYEMWNRASSGTVELKN